MSIFRFSLADGTHKFSPEPHTPSSRSTSMGRLDMVVGSRGISLRNGERRHTKVRALISDIVIIGSDVKNGLLPDLMKGLDYALEQYTFIDPRRVAALGASYGGYMINWINGHTDRFRCLGTFISYEVGTGWLG